MKIKVTVVILALAALGLAIGLIKTNQDATKQHSDDLASMEQLSNGWSKTSADLASEQQLTMQLRTDVTNRDVHIEQLSNDLAQTTETLTQKDAALKAALEEEAKREAKIADLESTNEALDKQALDLKGNINDLEAQIADTQKKLDASEGDKAFLQKELARLTAEKEELEKKFNDLAILRDQVRKLKEELDVSRRLEWIREGIFADQKGAQKLMQGTLASNGKPAGTNAYDLNVEVKSDGSVQVIPPITNGPASNSPPPVDPMSPIK